MRWLRENSLGLACGVLLVGALVGQALTGHAELNQVAADSQLPTLSLWEYVSSSHFTVDIAENWQSEYLQFLLFILLTVWLVQRGSPESKKPDEIGRESDQKQKVGGYASTNSPSWAKIRGWRLTVYSHSLGLVMGGIFLASWAAQLVAGRSAYNVEQLMELKRPLSWSEYAVAPDFWNRTFQNWQSEFLAVATMVVFSIFLRERGSPESKPVGASHDTTGVEG